ncbi:MAG: Holliday junction branch migration protein RuvA [Gemmatimonadota bacterium]|nr:Holliday junction branch migration protein RuvA [Gemmatimonadota bacterium]
MIAQVSGLLLGKELDRVEILTAGGIAYECLIPLSVFEVLPALNEKVALHTHLSVREDAWYLYGFVSRYERAVFQKLLVAKGVGPALALGILSALTAQRVISALREKDVITLMRVPRVGRKKAEQLILDLADKMDAFVGESSNAKTSAVGGGLSGDAVRALVSLGYTQMEADRAVKGESDSGKHKDVSSLVRAALARIANG